MPWERKVIAYCKALTREESTQNEWQWDTMQSILIYKSFRVTLLVLLTGHCAATKTEGNSNLTDVKFSFLSNPQIQSSNNFPIPVKFFENVSRSLSINPTMMMIYFDICGFSILTKIDV